MKSFILMYSCLLWIPISMILGIFVNPYLITLMLLSILHILVVAYAQVNGWIK